MQEKVHHSKWNRKSGRAEKCINQICFQQNFALNFLRNAEKDGERERQTDRQRERERERGLGLGLVYFRALDVASDKIQRVAI